MVVVVAAAVAAVAAVGGGGGWWLGAERAVAADERLVYISDTACDAHAMHMPVFYI